MREFRRHRVRAEEAGLHVDRARGREAPRDPELLELVRDAETIAGLHLDRRHPLTDESIKARERRGEERIFIERSGRPDRRADPAPSAGDILITCPSEARLKLICPIPPIDKVRVAVDEPRSEQRSPTIMDHLRELLGGTGERRTGADKSNL